MITIGITVDIADDRYRVAPAYAHWVAEAGAVPLLLPCREDQIDAFLDRCDGFVLTGGDDPRTERYGEPTHPKATPVHPERQHFEAELLAALDDRPDVPVFGVCLGMQMMALHRGGRLDQHLPESLATADHHWGRVDHEVSGSMGAGTVRSHHRQAVTESGTMTVVAIAPDGVIEAVADPARPFYLGVQWHPERTSARTLGPGLFEQLVRAARLTAT